MKKLFTALFILLIIAGISILLYPAVSNYINEKNGSYAIEQMSDTVQNKPAEELAKQKSMAESYNASLRNDGRENSCPYSYEEILDFGNGIMGAVVIPAIDVNLPIYHGVSSDTLAKGIGHLPDSAFPIGGRGNHSVLTGHTGLPSALLFTRLKELALGDVFYIEILGETLTYQIDQIVTVLPSQVENLRVANGMDYCTLVTCTPYGVNSHRLLVRGVRIIQ